MAIADDFSIDVSGNVRRTGTAAANHSCLAFKEFLGGLSDDAQAAGDDIVDIVTEMPILRTTDQIFEIPTTHNIDDTAARHLFGGSISQNDGDDLWAGLEIQGTVVAGTEPVIIQDGKVLPAYWGTGINAGGNVISSMMIKVREGGADIDGKRITVRAGEFNDQFSESLVTLGTGVTVAFLQTGDDIFNDTADTTVRAWSISNIEGLRLLDIDGDTVNEEYYSEYDKDTQSVNDTYEFSKLSQARAGIVLSGTDTLTDYTIDNATIVGQAQSFTTLAVAMKLSEARFNIKIDTGTPTGPLHAELYASTAGVIPTGAALATSEPVLASLITTAYAETIFRFNDNVTMSASTQYCIVIRHPDGAAGDFFAVEGAASGSVGGENAAAEDPVSTWTAVGAADLNFTVKGCPLLYGRAGELHRGITHSVVYDGEAGAGFTELSQIFWGTRITYDGESGTFEVGRYVEFQPSGGGTKKNGGKILFDDTAGNVLYVALEDSTGAGAGQLLDNDIITQIGGTAASANIATTIVDDDKAGGIGVILALDDDGAAGNLYIQVIHGVAPVDNLRMSQALADFALVNVTVTARTINPEFIGISTGTNIIGAYGIGFEAADVGSSDLLQDLSGTQNTPPNNVTFTVTALVSGDRVLVGPRTGSALNRAQLVTDVTLSAASETQIQCSTAIPAGTPTSGTGAGNTRVRVELDSGIYKRVPYDSFSGNDFAITVGPEDDFTGDNATAGNNVFVAYIDVAADATTEAYSAVHTTDVDLIVRVRDGGATPIKPFDGVTAVFGDTDSSFAAIRTPDA